LHRLDPKKEYDEKLTVLVAVTSDGGEEKIVFSREIHGKKQFNSWFYFAFDEEVVLRKGEKWTVQVLPEVGVNFLMIREVQVRETLAAAKCSAERRVHFAYSSGSVWRKCTGQAYIIKSISLQSIN